jgi:3-hydroxybutyryl-CoA dehydrogenase
MEIQTIGVIGAGTMGNGIAQACAVSGLDVVMVDIAEDAVQRGLAAVATSLDRLVKKGKLTLDAQVAALARIRVGTDYALLQPAQLVIEAATENEGLKRKILALVEVIRGLQTSDATHAAVMAMAQRLGKTPVTVKNAPGFVVNRILIPMVNEAFFVLAEGLATAEDIDAGMKLGCNHPIGPLALADMIGLDVCLAVMNVYVEEFADSKYRPCPLLKVMVAAATDPTPRGWRAAAGGAAAAAPPARGRSRGCARADRRFGRRCRRRPGAAWARWRGAVPTRRNRPSAARPAACRARPRNLP